MKMSDLLAVEDKIAGSSPVLTECPVIDLTTWSIGEQIGVIAATHVGGWLLVLVYFWACWKAVNALHWIVGKVWQMWFAPLHPAPTPEGYCVQTADECLDTVYEQLVDLRTALRLGRNDVARDRVEQMLHELEA